MATRPCRRRRGGRPPPSCRASLPRRASAATWVVQRGRQAGIGEIGPGLRDGVKRPDGRRPDRPAPTISPARRFSRLSPVSRSPADKPAVSAIRSGHDVLGLVVQHMRQPVSLARDQAREIGRGARRALDQRAQLGRQMVQMRQRLRPAVELWGIGWRVRRECKGSWGGDRPSRGGTSIAARRVSHAWDRFSHI